MIVLKVMALTTRSTKYSEACLYPMKDVRETFAHRETYACIYTYLYLTLRENDDRSLWKMDTLHEKSYGFIEIGARVSRAVHHHDGILQGVVRRTTPRIAGTTTSASQLSNKAKALSDPGRETQPSLS